MLNLKSLAVALAICAAGASVCRADILGYGVDTNDDLYSINLTSGAISLIGNTQVFLEGLAVSSGGQLFGTDSGGGLYSLNSTTGAASFIGNAGLGNIEGLDFNGATLVGTDFNNPTSFYALDTTTGAPTLLSTTSPSQGPARGMTIADSGHALILSDSPAFQSLISTDLGTGSSTNNGAVSSGAGIFGLDFGSDGNLYGLGGDGAIYQIDAATGGTTLLGNTGGQFWLDLAIPAGAAAVPEPGTYALLVGLAVPGVLLYRRRRA
jgi:hypothetical protein